MEVFDWSLDLLQFFVDAWAWLSSPFVTIGGVEISWLGFFSADILIIIIIAKLVELAIPV